MRTVVIALGSAGDVHPLLGIAVTLRRRGHLVTFLTNPHFESLVRRTGLDFHPIGSEADYELATLDPNLWDPYKGLEVSWRNVFEPAMRPTYESIERIAALEECIVVAPPFAFGARLAQEALGVALITVHLQPAMLRTCYHGIQAGGVTIPDWLPMRGRSWLWRLVDQFFADPLFCPQLNGFRRAIGLKPVKNVLGHWIHSPDRCIALFPDWFARAQPDWPPQLVLTDFPLFDEATIRESPPQLDEFLAEGGRPIVFTPGSSMRHARRFFQESIEACRMLNQRGIFLTPYADQVPSELPSTVRHFDYVPFSLLLRNAAALVHHGGIGTCAQAMKAGVPQLVVPMAHDQFDNASRMGMLGLGCSLRQAQYKKPVVAQRLERLMKDESVKAQCRSVSQNFRAKQPLSDICSVVDSDLLACASRA